MRNAKSWQNINYDKLFHSNFIMFQTPVFQRSCKVLFKFPPVTELKPKHEIVVTEHKFSNINILLMMIMKALVLSRDGDWSFKNSLKILVEFHRFCRNAFYKWCLKVLESECIALTFKTICSLILAVLKSKVVLGSQPE